MFQHEREDVASFRLITSQMIANGSMRHSEVARTFGMPLATVKRYVKLYRERGTQGDLPVHPGNLALKFIPSFIRIVPHHYGRRDLVRRLLPRASPASTVDFCMCRNYRLSPDSGQLRCICGKLLYHRLTEWRRDQGSGSHSASQRFLVALAMVLILFAGLIVKRHIDSRHLAVSVSSNYPVAAADFIERNHLGRPLFNTYGWDGYLMWRLPYLPVSIDGMANVYGAA